MAPLFLVVGPAWPVIDSGVADHADLQQTPKTGGLPSPEVVYHARSLGRWRPPTTGGDQVRTRNGNVAGLDRWAKGFCQNSGNRHGYQAGYAGPVAFRTQNIINLSSAGFRKKRIGGANRTARVSDRCHSRKTIFSLPFLDAAKSNLQHTSTQTCLLGESHGCNESYTLDPSFFYVPGSGRRRGRRGHCGGVFAAGQPVGDAYIEWVPVHGPPPTIGDSGPTIRP